jgi:hypothetical protein
MLNFHKNVKLIISNQNYKRYVSQNSPCRLGVTNGVEGLEQSEADLEASDGTQTDAEGICSFLSHSEYLISFFQSLSLL